MDKSKVPHFQILAHPVFNDLRQQEKNPFKIVV